MRIKLFEGFNTNDYYRKISIIEFIETPILDISDRIISKIKNLGLDIVKLQSAKISNSIAYKTVNIGYTRLGRGSFKEPDAGANEVVTIIECEDDYFIVQFNNKIPINVLRILNLDLNDDVRNYKIYNYKCDQWDGLVKFLKDTKII
jgi:hypothetical protein